jgi:hypothetical protein
MFDETNLHLDPAGLSHADLARNVRRLLAMPNRTKGQAWFLAQLRAEYDHRSRLQLAQGSPDSAPQPRDTAPGETKLQPLVNRRG